MRVAVLGCGSIGQRHIGNLLQLGYTDLVAFDVASRARDDVARQHGVVVHAALDAVWATHPNAVLVTAPTNLHVELASEAARHDCALFIEKPLSYSLNGTAELLEETRRRGLITMVGCNMRFHPGPAQVKGWLDEGAIGTVLSARIRTGSYLPRWRPGQDYRQSYSASTEWGGAVLDCIHELDLATWLLGKGRLVASVTRPACSLGLQTDGLAELLLEHKGDAISSVHLNFVQQNYRRTIEIVGSDGTIEWDFATGCTSLYGPDGEVAMQFPQPEDWHINDMYCDEMRHFLQHVQDGVPTCSPIGEAMETLELALAARRS